MHVQEVLFQIRSIKKPVMFFFKNDHKKMFSSQKLFETYYSLKKCLQVPKMVTPPPPPIKNNGPSLRKKLQTSFLEEWDVKTSRTSKLSFYRQYKQSHKLENYIVLVNNRRHKRALAKPGVVYMDLN